ncbi:MAG: ATP-binding protein [Planctomycetota bacterium]|nr:ATP-binding protein [Planctomycetota bacterium]
MTSEERISRTEAGVELKLTMPAHHLAAREGRQRVREFADSDGFPGDEVDRLEFVVGELLSNAVDHGGGNKAMDGSEAESGTAAVQMHLEFRFNRSGWELRVEDEGGGDPECLRPMLQDTGELPDLEDERGRGFFLLLGMLSSLKVESSRTGEGIALIAEVQFETPS